MPFIQHNSKWSIGLAVLAALWLLALLSFPISHNDTWWHLKCGEWVWQHHSFPDRDPFSYSSPDTPWLKASWLFNVSAWAVYSLAGLKGLIAAKLKVALICGAVALWFAVRRGAGFAMALGLICMAFLATRFGWTERPQTVAVLLFVLALAAFDGKRGILRNAALFLLGLLWSNFNPSAVLLPAFAAAYGLGLWLEGEGLDWAGPLSCFAGTLISPQWGSDYLDVLKLFGGQDIMRQMVAEWHAPKLMAEPALLFFYILLPVILLSALWQKKWRVVLLLVPAAIAAWRVGRMVPFFVFPAAIWAAALLPPLPRLAPLLGLALVAHGIYISAFDRLWGKTVDETQFPVQAAEFLAKARPKGNLGNLYRDGSYLMFRLGPETRVFIDSRAIIYPPRVFQAALAMEAGSPDWKNVVRDFKFSCMLLPRRSRVYEGWVSDKNWKTVYADDEFVIVATDAEIRSQKGLWQARPTK